jgi:hypothetical protein
MLEGVVFSPPATTIRHCPVRKLSTRSKAKRFKRNDHVTWNSEAGRVSGRIIRVHTKDVDWKGYVHHATRIKSDRTDHVALHKGTALKRMRG